MLSVGPQQGPFRLADLCKTFPYFLAFVIHIDQYNSRTFRVPEFAAFEVFYYLSFSYLSV